MAMCLDAPVTKKRGRPPGSKNRAPKQESSDPEYQTPKKRKHVKKETSKESVGTEGRNNASAQSKPTKASRKQKSESKKEKPQEQEKEKEKESKKEQKGGDKKEGERQRAAKMTGPEFLPILQSFAKFGWKGNKSSVCKNKQELAQKLFDQCEADGTNPNNRTATSLMVGFTLLIVVGACVIHSDVDSCSGS